MRKILLILFSFSFLLIGCIVAPYTRQYQPISEWESQEFNRANLNIYPNDVRKESNKYSDSTIAWVGIIKDSKIKTDENGVEIELLLEHHYYSWIEDFSIQQEKMFLSPKGEGFFRTSWFLKKDTNLEQLKASSEMDDLAIVYGNPEKLLEDSTIIIKSTYIRNIGKKWYRTDMMDYGRDEINTYKE